ncbi:3-deoxy-manno-octulosonate cytidylyltransferase [Thermotomaculum hydrothermale]|uniref:3-deoxy-manno-octulosonate cytidylyltransferase n=1 Tax=Thermotomaculum hydrothermale TaxID=981385 RepID=A0A7R6PN01_9BACT|nr:3-deoxy-manno-octulosonate cytidylyltransferase [Thermotomaculum hydrothermale]BBB32573.1 3-deoxy-manno-octulosonate cytidylyltransferase [Thermotomaculum hydrothermale]
MKVYAIIPSRYASTRLPGKPLLKIKGKSIIQMVYEQCKKVDLLEDVIVATGDERIFNEVKSFGGKCVMTSNKHKSGTDRIAEVALKIDADVIVNVQGDEPLIKPESIESAIKPFLEDGSIVMTTLKTKIKSKEELFNPNVVKVVCDKNNFALYFSRLPIPYKKTKEMGYPFPLSETEYSNYFKHTGLYAYKRDFLIKLSKMEMTFLEKTEGLEQLRVLENGYRIFVVETEFDSLGVDTMEDYLNLKKILGE